MKKHFLLPLFVVVAFTLTAYQITKSPDLQGSYAVNYGVKTSAFSKLKVHYKINAGILFYLEANRGAPDHNSGAGYGRLTLNKSTGNYEYVPTDTLDDCNLQFVKKGGQVVITTLHGDCGFGYGVIADGTYTLTSPANPLFFITHSGKSIYFDKTPPEKLSDY